MTKKLLALLMALVMCLSLVPTVAMADQTPAPVPVTETIYWGFKEGTKTLYISATNTDIEAKGVDASNVKTYTAQPWSEFKNSIEKVEVLTPVAPTSTLSWFLDCAALTSANLTNLETCHVTNMNKMFQNCSELATLTGLDNWDTASVTTMNYMFNGCKSLASLDLSGWNTSKVTMMAQMFNGCSALTSLILSGWDTSKVTEMGYMFKDCTALTNVGGLSDWDTSNVTTMAAMFYNCKALTSVGDISGWKTDSVTSVDAIFNGCSELTCLDLSGWDTSNVTRMSNVFADCAKLTELNLSGWDVASVTNVNMAKDVFKNCSALTTIETPKKLSQNVQLPGAVWYDGTATFTNLPKQATSTILRLYHEVQVDDGMDYGDVVVASGTTMIGGKNYATSGTPITLTVTPDTNYFVESVKATTTESQSVPVTVSGTNCYTFTMPAYAVTVTATFAEKVITVADILPEDFPTNSGGIPDNAWKNSVGSKMYIGNNGLTFGGVSLYNILNKPVTKDENNYKYTSNSYTITFVMDSGKLVKVITEGSEYAANNGEYIPTYTVSFSMNGHGTAPGAITKVVSGATITAPTTPTVTGYTFGGWFKDAACTNAWNFDTDTVTANTTLYAKWTKNSSGRSSGTVTTVVNMPLIRTGNRGDSVKELQTKLNALGYNCGSVDGIFGSKTYAAVVAFQKANGIGVDGIVGPETWGKLGVTGIIVTTAPAAATSAVMTTISSNMPLITKGSTGDAVKALQTKLNALGYDCGKVDGIFGDKTLAAVKAYQTDKALLVDGKVGSQTWGALR